MAFVRAASAYNPVRLPKLLAQAAGRNLPGFGNGFADPYAYDRVDLWDKAFLQARERPISGSCGCDGEIALWGFSTAPLNRERVRMGITRFVRNGATVARQSSSDRAAKIARSASGTHDVLMSVIDASRT